MGSNVEGQRRKKKKKSGDMGDEQKAEHETARNISSFTQSNTLNQQRLGRRTQKQKGGEMERSRGATYGRYERRLVKQVCGKSNKTE
jgi:hypothetical protein